VEARDSVEQEMGKQFEKLPRRELRSPPPPSLFPKTTVAVKDALGKPAKDSPTEDSPVVEDSAAASPESPAPSVADRQDDVIEEIEPVRKANVAPRGKMLIHSASFFLSPEKLRRGTYQPRKHSFFDENQVTVYFFYFSYLPILLGCLRPIL
jgi:hypothetical protein